jgi:biopolymer transport protein ExbD
MGGSQNIGEESDNPVEINVTAMVDVIFCLCIFFMCSFHFKQLEGKIDAWLPKERGNSIGDLKTPPMLEEVRLIMRWDPERQLTTRHIAARGGNATDDELVSTIRAIKKDYEKAGKIEVPVVVDAMDAVPWQDVVHALDLCKGEKLSPITFTEPFPAK